jgi:hypothetical protein
MAEEYDIWVRDPRLSFPFPLFLPLDWPRITSFLCMKGGLLASVSRAQALQSSSVSLHYKSHPVASVCIGSILFLSIQAQVIMGLLARGCGWLWVWRSRRPSGLWDCVWLSTPSEHYTLLTDSYGSDGLEEYRGKLLNPLLQHKPHQQFYHSFVLWQYYIL